MGRSMFLQNVGTCPLKYSLTSQETVIFKSSSLQGNFFLPSINIKKQNFSIISFRFITNPLILRDCFNVG